MRFEALRDRGRVATVWDLALTAMLVVQCSALFVVVPFAALGHPAMRGIAAYADEAHVEENRIFVPRVWQVQRVRPVY